MLPFSTYETDKLHTLCFNFGRLTCPELSDAAEGKYYYNFICFDKAGNKYVSDGNGTSKVVFAENDKKLVNDQMWALVGQNKDDVVLMSKDKYYVCLSGNGFNVTHDPERAVHFSVKYISSKQRYALTIVGGLNAEGKIGQSMNLSGADANRNTIIFGIQTFKQTQISASTSSPSPFRKTIPITKYSPSALGLSSRRTRLPPTR